MRIDTTKKPAGKPGRPSSGKPSGGPADLQQAFADLRRDQEQRAKWRKRKDRGSQRGPVEYLKLALTLLGVVLVGLLGDGLRRESQEFSARFVNLVGSVDVMLNGQDWQKADPKTELKDGNMVWAKADSSATLAFPDGSAVTLEADTKFEVRQLGYARDGKRNRSFMVRQGSVLARISGLFGGDIGSEATVCTPTAVAAVRGTAFAVTYDPNTAMSALQVVEGTVQYATPLGKVEASQGRMAVAAGYELAAAERLPAEVEQRLGSTRDALRPLEQPPSFVVRVERRLLSIGDPVLQLIGLAPGAWGYSSIDSARRAACMEALRRLRTHIEGQSEMPTLINPVTLVELELNPKEVQRLQSGWLNGMFDSYEALGQDQYRVIARARDRRHTVYEMTNADLRQLESAEQR